MYCSKCGKEIVPGNKFCTACGTAAPKENYDKEEKTSSNKTIIIAALLTLVVLLAVSGTAFFFVRQYQIRQETEREEELIAERRREIERAKREDKEGSEEDGKEESEDAGDLLGMLFGNSETAAEVSETEAAETTAVEEEAVVDESSYDSYEDDSYNEPYVLYWVRVNASDGYVNMRSDPAKGNNILYEVLVGSMLAVYDQEGDWLNVMYDNTLGWVHKTQVTAAETYPNGDLYAALCPWSSSELIKDQFTVDILQYNADTFFGLDYPRNKNFNQMIINEIYARHGYIFSTPEIQDYFMAQPWYNPVSNDMDGIYNRLNQIEKDNIKFLK